jgi:CIC family chloride channel protein
VLSQRGVAGVLLRETIETAAEKGDAESKLAELLPRGEFPHVHPDHSLSTALDRMGAANVNLLPVVSRANVHQMLGIVTLGDVLALYRVQKREQRIASGEH